MSIVVNDISYEINNNLILSNISLAIKGGEVLSILGPNGSGKSTLMRILAGDINPNSGSIIIDGENLNNIEISARAVIRSMMSQSQNIIYLNQTNSIFQRVFLT